MENKIETKLFLFVMFCFLRSDTLQLFFVFWWKLFCLALLCVCVFVCLYMHVVCASVFIAVCVCFLFFFGLPVHMFVYFVYSSCYTDISTWDRIQSIPLCVLSVPKTNQPILQIIFSLHSFNWFFFVSMKFFLESNNMGRNFDYFFW